ncbi:ABC transporter permease subunit [Pontibacillus yanchengensis]|uniref:ABC transporter permease n=1 Tax=Pontibacillus yanchengensis Y32 TaxID=1385514 RepID=A0A0A2TI17_9BACI|nr:ABC transporter permease subunit [Pontibacillus yanchengensis]KGP73711.1 ABC transporter permease [Pontibacillus yanchengensis Y32]
MQWWTIFQKELLENWRSLKWVWVPIVFILLAIMDPITSYYTPVLLEQFGDLPEGAEINIPTPTPEQAFMSSISQYNLMGLLLILIMTMGLISGERKSGVTELILVKPVRYTNYITAKWASTLLLVLTSSFLGLLASWYYINILFGDLPFSHAMTGFLFHSVWYVLVITISVFLNTLFRVPGLVGFLSVTSVIVLSSINGIFKSQFEWLPPQIHLYIQTFLNSGTLPTDMWITTVLTILLSAILLMLSVFIFKKKELAS